MDPKENLVSDRAPTWMQWTVQNAATSMVLTSGFSNINVQASLLGDLVNM